VTELPLLCDAELNIDDADPRQLNRGPGRLCTAEISGDQHDEMKDRMEGIINSFGLPQSSVSEYPK
jgi:hypothetical protein